MAARAGGSRARVARARQRSRSGSRSLTTRRGGIARRGRPTARDRALHDRPRRSGTGRPAAAAPARDDHRFRRADDPGALGDRRRTRGGAARRRSARCCSGALRGLVAGVALAANAGVVEASREARPAALGLLGIVVATLLLRRRSRARRRLAVGCVRHRRRDAAAHAPTRRIRARSPRGDAHRATRPSRPARCRRRAGRRHGRRGRSAGLDGGRSARCRVRRRHPRPRAPRQGPRPRGRLESRPGRRRSGGPVRPLRPPA